MITPILERLILKGEANYTLHHHAYSMFGRIPAQSGKLAIIEKIIWYPFINPVVDSGAVMSWNQFFKSNEYQLKIDGKKTVSYYQFRNSIKWNLTDSLVPIDMSAPIAAGDFNKLVLQPGEPVTIDTYLVCSEVIKLTISRNAFVSSFVDTYALLSPRAGEPNAPDGVGDMDILQKTAAFSFSGATWPYNPPSTEFSGVASGGARAKQNYVNDYIYKNGNNYQSQLSPVGSGMNGGFLTKGPSITHPLVTFGIVYVNENIADQLQSTT